MIKKLTILGAGESGVGTAILAQKMGWNVFVSDVNKIRGKYKSELEKRNIQWEENIHTEDIILNADCVVKSPGISNEINLIKKIRHKRIKIISEVEFAFQYTKAKIIAVTGSNGKTTTTYLIYDILKKADIKVEIAGNMGESFSRKVAALSPDFFVLEISSFQLDDIVEFSPHIAVILNITPDHLNRYQGKYSRYIDAKLKIAQNQKGKDFFIYNKDDEILLKFLREKALKSQIIPFSQKVILPKGAFIKDNGLSTIINKNTFNMKLNKLSLKGQHNVYNSMAAAIVANILEIDNPIIRDALSSFKGKEHRLEKVLTIRDVSYINDSKATNINSVWYALECIKTPIVWIAGGTDKGNNYNLLKDMVSEKVKAIICLTKSSEKLHNAFDEIISTVVDTQSMKNAVDLAYKLSDKGDTVLLSPACASFDLFKDYEDRGNQFKEAVRNL